MLRRGFILQNYPSANTLLFALIDKGIELEELYIDNYVMKNDPSRNNSTITTPAIKEKNIDDNIEDDHSDDDEDDSTIHSYIDARSAAGRQQRQQNLHSNKNSGSSTSITAITTTTNVANITKKVNYNGEELLSNHHQICATILQEWIDIFGGKDIESSDDNSQSSSTIVTLPVPLFIILDYLFRNYKLNPNIMRPADGYTPLHLACLQGLSSMVLTLINNGADVNSIAIDGSTPLSCTLQGMNDTLGSISNTMEYQYIESNYLKIIAALEHKKALVSWQDILSKLRSTIPSSTTIIEPYDPIMEALRARGRAYEESKQDNLSSNIASSTALYHNNEKQTVTMSRANGSVGGSVSIEPIVGSNTSTSTEPKKYTTKLSVSSTTNHMMSNVISSTSTFHISPYTVEIYDDDDTNEEQIIENNHNSNSVSNIASNTSTSLSVDALHRLSSFLDNAITLPNTIENRNNTNQHLTYTEGGYMRSTSNTVSEHPVASTKRREGLVSVSGTAAPAKAYSNIK